MAESSIADSAKPYLDYLDKEMTIEGILSAFCVAVGAVVFDRILGAKGDSASGLVAALQYFSYPYVLAAIVGLMAAALFFYLQRSALAWRYGELSLVIAELMVSRTDEDNTTVFMDSLEVSRSLWNRYKFGWSFLAVTAVEVLFALFFAIKRWSLPDVHWLIAGFPFLVAGTVDLLILVTMNKRDRKDESEKG